MTDSKMVPAAGYADLVRKQLAMLGEDPEREGLQRTPERVARAMTYLTRGYRDDVHTIVGKGVFAEDHENMVMVRDIELYSLCEHHLLPFFGRDRGSPLAARRRRGDRGRAPVHDDAGRGKTELEDDHVGVTRKFPQ